MRLVSLVPSLVLCGLFCVICTDISAQSQAEPRVEPLEITPSGAAYLQSLRFRGIEANVAYYDPTRPAPALETTAEPPRQSDRSGPSGDQVQVIDLIISIAIISGVIAVVYFFGGQMGLSLGGAVKNAERDENGRAMPINAFGSTLPKRLQDILEMQDRRAALMALAQYALARVITANGLRLQRSWTVRDALRRIPHEQSHLAQLRALVLAAEGVHFGARDVTEDDFNVHVKATQPLLREPAP
ncbi:MAG: DUF4129 domain-containing protein [Pseudomonadota bacterium]